MESRPIIQVMQPFHITEAKRVICTVVHEIFIGHPSPEHVDALLKSYEAKNEFADITDFQRHYLENKGLFLVLLDEGRVVGTGAVRRLDDLTAELKRMWFLSKYRGRGLGRTMAEQLLEFARQQGFKQVRLDTGHKQPQALRLYQRLGFRPISRYNDSTCDLFMELVL